MKPQLFLLHFAGGSCYSYNFLQGGLSRFEIISLELPGRGKRMSESLLKSFDEAVADYVGQIISKLKSPVFGVYGHSMGAALGLKIVSELEQAGKFPFCLFVSGNPGPGIYMERNRYLLNKAQFKEELIRIGGVQKGVLEDEELYDFFEPILRADFEVVEKHQGVLMPVIKSPVIALMGDGEEKVEHIANWKSYTVNKFTYRIFEGDHFFIYKYVTELTKIINESFNELKPVQQ